MKILFTAITFSMLLHASIHAAPAPKASPLAAFSTQWNAAIYQKANTAKNAKYLSSSEQQLIYVLNLARMNPTLFMETVIKKMPAKWHRTDLLQQKDYLSLLADLKKQKPLSLLMPDSLLWVSASCHAISAGAAGFVGHERQNESCEKKSRFMGECCHYGYSNPVEIIVSLLIDEDVPSLGHRKICLGSYAKIGVAIASHTSYGYNSVLDFY